MQNTQTLKEQLINWGKKLQGSTKGNIYIENPDGEGYFNALINYGDPDLLNSTKVQVLDVETKLKDGVVTWNWAFKLDSKNLGDLANSLVDLLDDDDLGITATTLPESDYYLIHTEV